MINYKILHESIIFYEGCGYKRIELPWTVTKPISDITKPQDCDNFTIIEKNKVLVASGEQSFLYLYNKGYLPKGKFQGITPCFRNDMFDSLHSKYFMKNELIQTDMVSVKELETMIDSALIFFNKYVGNASIKETGHNTFDIEYMGIELGSYGIRECDFLKWIYGTAVAEPRLTRVIQKYGLQTPPKR